VSSQARAADQFGLKKVVLNKVMGVARWPGSAMGMAARLRICRLMSTISFY
jgi:hypothetical protein